MERCIHWMSKDTCSICNPQKPKRPNPHHREDRTLHGALAVDPENAREQGYVVVRTQAKNAREHPSFHEVNERTALVHIHGHPFLWAIEEVLKRAPNLRTIRIVPTMQGKMSSAHRELCQKRQVQLITGYHMPQLAWEEGENRSPFYQAQQTFLLNLQGEQKVLFEELLTFGFEAASMTSRYFCLRNEVYLSQRRLCVEYGYPDSMHHNISQKINTVLYYLDPSFDPGDRAKEMAEAIKARLPRLRAMFHSDVLRKKYAEDFRVKYGVPLASNFPFVRLETFEKLLEARASGKLNALRAEEPKNWKVLTLRFGLDKAGTDVGIYRKLEQIGEMMGVTRERIRQREEKAFEFLGIIPSAVARAGKPVEDEL